MNAIDAADATVHDYPGGSESLAPRLGMSAAVLRNKVNPNNDRNHLTLAEADRIMGATGDYRVLQALGAAHGFALQRLDDAAEPQSATSMTLGISMTGGDLARAIHDAMADGIITENEMKDIEAFGFESQRFTISVLGWLRARTGKRVAP
jgi:hypothetical protein